MLPATLILSAAVFARMAIVMFVLSAMAAGPGCNPLQTPDGCTQAAHVYADSTDGPDGWQCTPENLTFSGGLSAPITRAGSAEGCHRGGAQLTDFLIPLAFEYDHNPTLMRLVVHGFAGPGRYTTFDLTLYNQRGAPNTHYAVTGGYISVGAGQSSGTIDASIQVRYRSLTSKARLTGSWTCPIARCPSTEAFQPSAVSLCVDQDLHDNPFVPSGRGAVLQPCGQIGKSFNANIVFGTPPTASELSVHIPLYTGPHLYPASDVSLTVLYVYSPTPYTPVVGANGYLAINPSGESGVLTDNYGLPNAPGTGVEFVRATDQPVDVNVSGSFECVPPGSGVRPYGS
jgi:hypothetical protein